MKIVLWSCASLAAIAAPLSGQVGYEWDHADQVGVRYRIYNQMSKHDGASKQQPDPHVVLRYIPESQDDIIRVNGYPYQWGLNVYEFPKQAKADDQAAESFEDWLLHHDPAANGRQVKVEGKETSDYRYWEYYDVMSKKIIEPTPAGGGLVWEYIPALGVRFKALEGMSFNEPDLRYDGPQARWELIARNGDWAQVPGASRPLSWGIVLHDFGWEGEKRSDSRWSDTFEGFVKKSGNYTKNAKTANARTFVTEGKAMGRGEDAARFWEYYDDRQTALEVDFCNYYFLGASHNVGGRELALEVKMPVGGGKDLALDRKLHKKLKTMVTSLETFDVAKLSKKKPGGPIYWSMAAVYDLPDRQVAMVASIPVDAGKKPDKRAVRLAKTMLESLEIKGE